MLLGIWWGLGGGGVEGGTGSVGATLIGRASLDHDGCSLPVAVLDTVLGGLLVGGGDIWWRGEEWMVGGWGGVSGYSNITSLSISCHPHTHSKGCGYIFLLPTPLHPHRPVQVECDIW